MSIPSKAAPDKIHALTSLRFFAALYVVLFHILGARFDTGSLPPALLQAASFGYISVSFFFLLSGYILAFVYLRSSRPLKKSKFYVARFARIYPLFFITMAADAPFVYKFNATYFGFDRAILKTAATMGAHILMLQAWLPGLHGIDQPNWSLSVETVFYVIFPIIGISLWKLRGRWLWAVAVCVWLASQIAVILVTPHLRATTAKFHPLLHVGTFILGILLARWQLLRIAEGRDSTDRKVGTLAIIAVGAAIAAAMKWGSSLPVSNLNDGLLSPLFAVVIWACSTGDNLLIRFLRAKWLVILGESSFGLYLIHMPVLHLFERLGWTERIVMLPTYLILCIGLSVVSFYFVETPSRNWILRRLQTATKETMEVASDA